VNTPLFPRLRPLAAHRAMMQQVPSRVRGCEVDYSLPELKLVREDGKTVAPNDALGDMTVTKFVVNEALDDALLQKPQPAMAAAPGAKKQ